MNSFYTIAMVGLLTVSVPAWGMDKMDKDEKMDALNSQTGRPAGFSVDAQQCLTLFAAAAGVTFIGSKALSHIDISNVIHQSSSPLFTRASLVASGVAVPLFFLMSLKNNLDFWKKAGFWNRGFLFCSTLLSASSAYVGLSSLRA